MSRPITQTTRSKREGLEIDVTRARTGDVAAVRSLLLQHFGYIYLNLLGTDKERASATLDLILKANQGQHPLGYKTFYVAQSKDHHQKRTYGILKFKMKSPGEGPSTLLAGLSVLKILLRNIGLRGTFRTLRKWFAIRSINADVEADELHVVYLAVSDAVRRRHVGKQLLNFAKMIAVAERKKTLSLYVREKNVDALSFFLNQGFSIDRTVIDTEADNLLMQGASTRMTMKVLTPTEGFDQQ